jgi:ferritin-like metal-binding protein YciE
MQLDTLQDALEMELADLYSAEKQLVDSLPKAARAASNSALKTALEQHLKETQNHVTRLDKVFFHSWKPAKAGSV